MLLWRRESPETAGSKVLNQLVKWRSTWEQLLTLEKVTMCWQKMKRWWRQQESLVPFDEKELEEDLVMFYLLFRHFLTKWGTPRKDNKKRFPNKDDDKTDPDRWLREKEERFKTKLEIKHPTTGRWNCTSKDTTVESAVQFCHCAATVCNRSTRHVI